MSNPICSVCIITYNQQETIRQTIDSVINQKTNYDFEIIIGDDCSSDHTPEIITEYQHKYDFVYSILSNKNTGVVENVLRVLNRCRGKYITECAGDDYWHNDLKLDKQIRYLENNPDVGLVHSNYNVIYESNGKIVKNYSTSINVKNINFLKLLNGNLIGSITVCYRRELLDNYIDFNEIRNNFSIEDYPMWLDVAYNSRISYMDESLATYRINSESVSHTNKKNKEFEFYKEIIKITKYYLKKYKIDDPDSSRILFHVYNTHLRNARAFNNKLLAQYTYDLIRSEFPNDLNFTHYLIKSGSSNCTSRIISKAIEKVLRGIL
jgi:glycosyltransferase involved in cell wall biosynthesis